SFAWASSAARRAASACVNGMVSIQAIREGLAAAGPARDVELAEAARGLLALPRLPRLGLGRCRRRLLGFGSGVGRRSDLLGALGALRLFVFAQMALLLLLAGTAMARIVAAQLVSRWFCQGPPPNLRV